jgi:hypothetical protein
VQEAASATLTSFEDWPLGTQVIVGGFSVADLGGLVRALVAAVFWDCRRLEDAQGVYCQRNVGFADAVPTSAVTPRIAVV